MMHLLSLPISLELKGRTLTATLTEAPAILQVVRVVWQGRRLEAAQADDCMNISLALYKLDSVYWPTNLFIYVFVYSL